MCTAIKVFQRGGIIAYPTEAVFGLGCDPDNQNAIEKLLRIKNRSKAKGLILLASNFEQLLPYLDLTQLTDEQVNVILNRWPNGVTQILPARTGISSYLTGDFTTIAVRITNQPDVVTLCTQTNKPIVSTSANLSGIRPAKMWQTLDPTLTELVDYLIKGKTLGYIQPSTIIDGLTGEVFRT